MLYFPNVKIDFAKDFPNTNKKWELFTLWGNLESDLIESSILGKLK